MYSSKIGVEESYHWADASKQDIEGGVNLVSIDLLFKSIKSPNSKDMGVLIPVKCGHRGIIKEKEKEKLVIDRLIKEAGFTSSVGCSLAKQSSTEETS